MTVRSIRGLLVFVGMLVAPAPLLALNDPPLTNWAVPAASGGHRLSPLGDIGAPTPFVPIAPCRIVDTRGGAPLGGGVGIFGSGETRSYDLNSAGAPCNGIPAGVVGYSVNVTVTNETRPGYVAIYPTGNPPNPMISLVNYRAATAIANATIVPCDTSGSVTVLNQGAQADVVLDINGYFSSTPAPGTDAFRIYTNNGMYAGYFSNTSTTCTGTCGLFGGTASTQADAAAVGGYASGTTNPNYGVSGIASGTGTLATGLPSATAMSAGVYGKAASTTGVVAGVIGETVSSSIYAAGVLGLASNANANGGLFFNSGGSIDVQLASGNGGVWTDSSIFGVSLYISGAKNFVSPHPVDPSKEIVYAAIEGPSADVFFRGTGHLVNGIALIPIPEHFRLTAREDSYMTTLTAVGSRPTVWVESEGPDGIVVRGAGDSVFHYVVYAERDETRDQEPVRGNTHFVPQRLAQGMLKTLPARTFALLVKNGTINPDGTFNEATARRLGWALPSETVAPAAAGARP